MNRVSREDVREVLRGFFDSARLATSQLISCFPGIAAITALDERADRMRSLLLEGIEALRPPRAFAFGSLESRSYDVLTLHYVEGMTIPRMAEELALSERQVQRDLSQAEEKLAQMLSTWAVSHGRTGGRQREDSLSDELMALASRPVQVHLEELVQAAVRLLGPLAAERGIAVIAEAPSSALTRIAADAALLKQLLVQLLSCAIQATVGRTVSVVIEADDALATVVVCFQADAGSLQRTRLLDAQRIASSRGIVCRLSLDPPERAELALQLKRGTPISVLVVEDNPDAVSLYQRYLASSNWQLHSVSDPRLAPEAARRNKPGIIILDIMMPSMDGWTVLESLRQQPETAFIPVLVCSVVDDPELASALGATGYLQKPFSQGQLLASLQQCLASARRTLR